MVHSATGDQSDSSLLFELINTTEYLSTQIHQAGKQQEIFELIEHEFRKSRRFNFAIMLLNKEKNALTISAYSPPRKIIALAEEICNVSINDSEFPLNTAPNFSKVVLEGHSLYIQVKHMIREIIPGPLSSVIANVFRISNRKCIVTPLNRKSGCIGVLVIASDGLIEELIPSVKYFAENIAITLDLVDEAHDRELFQKALQESEALLENDRKALKEKNIALKELLNQIESEKNSIQHQFTDNVEKILLPIVDKLRRKASSIEKKYLDLLEKYLCETTSPFIGNLSHKFSKLTHREIEICTMIKNGLTSKEIAALLNISTLTVHRYREFIRRKLGITNKSVNLTAFLNTGELKD